MNEDTTVNEIMDIQRNSSQVFLNLGTKQVADWIIYSMISIEQRKLAKKIKRLLKRFWKQPEKGWEKCGAN